MNEIKNPHDIAGYDGYIIGSPTFSLDMPAQVKAFLALLKKIPVEAKTRRCVSDLTCMIASYQA